MHEGWGKHGLIVPYTEGVSERAAQTSSNRVYIPLLTQVAVLLSATELREHLDASARIASLSVRYAWSGVVPRPRIKSAAHPNSSHGVIQGRGESRTAKQFYLPCHTRIM